MPLRSIHGTKVNIRLPRSHQGRLCICRTKTSRLVSRCVRKKIGVKCLQSVTACCTSASVAKYLPARCFFRVPKKY